MFEIDTDYWHVQEATSERLVLSLTTTGDVYSIRYDGYVVINDGGASAPVDVLIDALLQLRSIALWYFSPDVQYIKDSTTITEDIVQSKVASLRRYGFRMF